VCVLSSVVLGERGGFFSHHRDPAWEVAQGERGRKKGKGAQSLSPSPLPPSSLGVKCKKPVETSPTLLPLRYSHFLATDPTKASEAQCPKRSDILKA